MTVYRFEYKCRLCGEVYYPSGTGDKQIAHDAIIDLICCGKTKQVTMYHFHLCNENNMGIADLQGVKEYEE